MLFIFVGSLVHFFQNKGAYMSTKNTRSGGKFAGGHTTVIPTAGLVADVVAKLSEVTKILPGFISSGLHPTNGQRRVKIIDGQGSLLLAVRDNATHQELRVFTRDPYATKLAVARYARNLGLRIAFGKEGK